MHIWGLQPHGLFPLWPMAWGPAAPALQRQLGIRGSWDLLWDDMVIMGLTMGFYDFSDFYGIGINDGLTSEIKEGRKTRISQMELGYGWLCFPEVWPPTAKIILLDFQIKWHKDVSMISIGVSPANWHCWRPSEYGDASCQSRHVDSSVLNLKTLRR